MREMLAVSYILGNVSLHSRCNSTINSWLRPQETGDRPQCQRRLRCLQFPCSASPVEFADFIVLGVHSSYWRTDLQAYKSSYWRTDLQA